MKNKSFHLGRKVGRIRELRGIKQETLASELGISQQAISKLEQSDTIDDVVLENIAKALGVTTDGIKSFSEESIINYFNSFNDQSVNQGPIGANNTCNFNPVEKIVELYERLLASEREKNEILKNNAKQS